MVMLVGNNKIFQDVVYIRLPENNMAKMFEGYEKCGAPGESQVIGLYGDQEDLNEYIKQRR